MIESSVANRGILHKAADRRRVVSKRRWNVALKTRDRVHIGTDSHLRKTGHENGARSEPRIHAAIILQSVNYP